MKEYENPSPANPGEGILLLWVSCMMVSCVECAMRVEKSLRTKERVENRKYREVVYRLLVREIV